MLSPHHSLVIPHARSCPLRRRFRPPFLSRFTAIFLTAREVRALTHISDEHDQFTPLRGLGTAFLYEILIPTLRRAASKIYASRPIFAVTRGLSATRWRLSCST